MFSKTTEYALRAVIFIAQVGNVDQKLSLSQVAEAIDSPPAFTAKILQQLTVDNRIVSSVRGPNGGFFVTDKAKKLPIRTILEAMGEDAIFTKCVLGLKLCSEVNPCPMHSEYKKIKQQIINLFEKKTILELAKDLQSGDTFINCLALPKKRKKLSVL